MSPRPVLLLFLLFTASCAVVDEAPLPPAPDPPQESEPAQTPASAPEFKAPESPTDPKTLEPVPLDPTPLPIPGIQDTVTARAPAHTQHCVLEPCAPPVPQIPGCEGVGPNDDRIFAHMGREGHTRIYGEVCHESVGLWLSFTIGPGSVFVVTEPGEGLFQGYTRGADGAVRPCVDPGITPTKPLTTNHPDVKPTYLCHATTQERTVYVHLLGPAKGYGTFAVAQTTPYAHFDHDCQSREDDLPYTSLIQPGFWFFHENFLCDAGDEDWYTLKVHDSAGRVVTLTPGDANQELTLEVCRGDRECQDIPTNGSLRSQNGAPISWTIPQVDQAHPNWMLRIRGDVSPKPYRLNYE